MAVRRPAPRANGPGRGVRGPRILWLAVVLLAASCTGDPAPEPAGPSPGASISSVGSLVHFHPGLAVERTYAEGLAATIHHFRDLDLPAERVTFVLSNFRFTTGCTAEVVEAPRGEVAASRRALRQAGSEVVRRSGPILVGVSCRLTSPQPEPSSG